MKALSIQEPWASLIEEGKKTIETRIWTTDHRGDIILCASKKPKGRLSGYAFAIAELYKIERMTKEHEKDAICEVYPNAYSWFLRDLRPIRFPVKGQLKLFEVDPFRGKIWDMKCDLEKCPHGHKSGHILCDSCKHFICSGDG